MWEATLQTNWRCAGGVPLTDLGIIGSESVLTEQLDNRSGCTLQLASQYFDVCRHRFVVMLVAEDGQWWEFRIDELTRNHATTAFALDLVPPWFDLESADLVREQVGSRLLESFTERRTPTEFISARVLANAAADGLGWMGLGTVDFTQEIELAWKRLDRAAFLNLLPTAFKRGELALRAVNFDGYVVDFVEAIGAGANPIPVLFGERLRAANGTVGFGDLYTAVRVYGESSSDEVSPASGTNNVWRVASVTALGAGSTAPYAVALRDPAQPSVSPIQLDGVFAVDPDSLVPPCYLQLEDGTHHVIQQSRAATGDVVIAVAPTVGDRVAIVADINGAPLDRIAWPQAVREHGIVIADARVAGARGDRNYLHNPGFDTGLTDWTAPVGSQMTRILRALPPSITGTVSGSGTLPNHFAITGPTNAVLTRGDRVRVSGVSLEASAAALADASGNFTLPLTAALAATLPDGTQLLSPVFTSSAFYADGAGNTAGATSLAVRSGGFSTVPWVAGDQLSISALEEQLRTVNFVVDPFAQFVVFDLDTGFTAARAVGQTVEWQDGYGGVIMLTVAAYYSAFATQITLAHPYYFPGGGTPPFGGAGDTLAFPVPSISAHTVSGTLPTWGTNKRATVTITPALPIAAAAATTVITWLRSGGSPSLGTLALYADVAAGATAIVVFGEVQAKVFEAGYLLLVPSVDSQLVNPVTLDGSGAGEVQLNTAPGSTPVTGSVVTITRHTEWAEADGGGAGVMLCESQFVLDDSAPTNAQASPRSRAFRVIVPTGEAREVAATVALTCWSQRVTDATMPYAYGKVALVNTVTNAVVAWAKLEPDNAASLTSPANARLPLTWDAGTTRFLPLHVRLQCSVILTATTTLQLRVYGPSGIEQTDRARLYVRWGVVHVPGMTDVVYFDGSLDNALVLTAVELLARDGVPAETYQLELADIDVAHARAVELPDTVVAPVRMGSVLSPEELGVSPGVSLRVISSTRTPDRRTSSVTVGKRRPSQSLTLAANAVVSLGGAR